jgi:hypothetical protein
VESQRLEGGAHQRSASACISQPLWASVPHDQTFEGTTDSD